MFCQLVAVEVGVEGKYLIYGSVEGDTLHHSGKDVMDGIDILFRHPIVIKNEGGIAIEDGLTDSLLAVSVIRLVFGHSNPPI